MWNILRLIIILLMLIGSVYCGFQGVISPIRFSTDHIPTKKGRKLRVFYFILSIVFGYIAFTIYSQSMICTPLLVMFIGLIILEYYIFKGSSGFLKRK
jgi:hypothetical protein